MTSRTHPLRVIAIIAAVSIAPLVSALAQQQFRILDATYPPNMLTQKAPHEWGPFMHWDLREMPGCEVPWVMGLAPVPDLNHNLTPDDATDRGIAEAAFEWAFAAWDSVAPSKLNFKNTQSSPGVPQGGFVADQWNTLSFSPAVLPSIIGAQTALIYSQTTGRISEVDIVFNSRQLPFTVAGVVRVGPRQWVVKADGQTCDADIDSLPFGNWPNGPGDTNVDGDGVQDNEEDLRTIALHEIGHFIGLAHVDTLGGTTNDPANAVMEELWKVYEGPTGGGRANQTLKDQDRDGDNFLYCPDLGDAPDPWMGVFNKYPSKVHIPNMGRPLNGEQLDAVGLGAEHILGIKKVQFGRMWTYEWLARWKWRTSPPPATAIVDGNVDAECEANVPDLDKYDDGVTWYPNPPVWGETLTVDEWVVYSNDNAGNHHDYTAHSMWGNAWLDIDQDCQWFGYEHFLHKEMKPPAKSGHNALGITYARGLIALPDSVNPDLAVWLRCRLDWGEDSGSKVNIDGTLNFPAGAAQFGEVEDYPLYCARRYETIWLCNPYPFSWHGLALAFVGPSQPGDQSWSAVVNQNACVLSVNPPPLVTYVPPRNETVLEYDVPAYIPPSEYVTLAQCRPPGDGPPQGFVRAVVATDDMPVTTSPALVPVDHRIPTVNCAYHVYGQDSPYFGKARFTVGTVDLERGGWIDGPDTLTDAWDDTVRVTVGYRVSPNVIPIQNLSPCDPLYNQYPLHPVGTGTVTPEDAFEFLLNIPGDVPPGQHVILEVQSRWSTNVLVTNQIIEFPDPIGNPTAIHDTPPPRHLALENYPNPFNPTTMIRVALPAPAVVTLAVYDVSGRLVRTLVRSARKPMGVFEVEWDGTDAAGRSVASGVYFYRLTAGKATLTRKAVLLK